MATDIYGRVRLVYYLKHSCSGSTSIYLIEFNDNNREKCQICSKLTVEAPNAIVFIVNFDYI